MSLAAIAAAIILLIRPHGHAAPLPAPTPHAASAPPIAAVAAPKHVLPWTPGDRVAVRSEIENALDSAISGAGAVSLIAVAHDGTVLYSNGADRAVTPASVQKLIVSDAALSELGPQYRFQTLFAASQQPDGAAIDGDLWLVTSGDPSLQSKDVRAGVAALRRENVGSVQGSVVVDPSALAGEEINPLWNADDANEDFMAATSGASVDDDTVEFRIQGTQDGEAAVVRLNPSTAPVTYDGTITTGGGDDVTVGGTNQPNTFHLSGSIPAGALERFWVPVHGMPQYLASVASGMLRKADISVGRTPRTGTVPLDAVILWHHRSAPLQQLVKHMLIESDNHYAEQLMRTLGARDGDTGNDANGIAAERAILKAQAIPTPGLTLVDGSGLAHANRVSARTLAAILVRFDTQPGGNELYPLLARGGKDGTLKRYQFDAAAGRVRAKTGHLSDAAALAGYVDTYRHGRVAFAFLIDGSPGDPDDAIINAIDKIAQH